MSRLLDALYTIGIFLNQVLYFFSYGSVSKNETQHECLSLFSSLSRLDLPIKVNIV